MRQFDRQHHRLDGIEPEIAAHHPVMISGGAAMHPNDPSAFRKVGILTNDHATISHPAQILTGEEGKTASQPHGSGSSPNHLAVFRHGAGGPNSLGRIFHHRDVIPLGNRHDPGHVGALAIEMHRNNRLDPGRPLRICRQSFFNETRIDVVGNRINVDKQRPGAQPENTAHGGKKRIWRSQNQITGANPDGHQGRQQGIGATGDPNGMGRTAVGRHLPLQIFHLGAHDIGGGIDHPGNCRDDLVPQGLQLFM